MPKLSVKRDRFLAELDLSKSDIVVGTESWLDPDIASGEFFPPNYQVFRRDRPNGVHGDVFIAVIDSLVASEINSIQPDCENIWISISAKGVKPLYVDAFYRPPTTATDEVYIGKLSQAIEMIPPSAKLLLLGDFNISDVDWNSFTFLPGGKTMIDIALSRHLTQVVKESTRGKTS